MIVKYYFLANLKRWGIVNILRKITFKFELSSRSEAILWASKISVDIFEWCNEIDANLFSKTKVVIEEEKLRAFDLLEKAQLKTSGNACVELLYFLTILIKPNKVFETGVAHGWSTQIFLRAMSENGIGTLYSTDLPFLRIKNSHQNVGILVDKNYAMKWSLCLLGDRKGVSQLSKSSKIDFVHYDSDKSYHGRKSFYRNIRRHLSSEAIIIFDDVQDNLFFKHLVYEYNYTFYVFHYDNKYIGMVDISNKLAKLKGG
jgi:predicted O-methyltransferase YrrM